MVNEVIDCLREKGFTRQAVLLEGSTGMLYVLALTNPKWRSKVEESFGAGVYKILMNYKELYTNESPDAKIIRFAHNMPQLDKKHVEDMIKFEPKVYDTSSLDIKLDTKFDISHLRKASELCELIAKFENKAEQMIYNEVKSVAYDNPDLLFEIYKDADIIPENKAVNMQKLSGAYSTKLKFVLSILKRSIPDIVIGNFSHSIKDALPYFPYDNNKSVNQNAEGAILEAESILNDPDKYKKSFERWVQDLVDTKKERVIDKARYEIDLLSEADHEEDLGVILSEDFVRYKLYEERSLDREDENPFRSLLKAPLDLRKELLDKYHIQLDEYNHAFIGLQQILEGGQITNPNASAVSVKQNHHGFPNIKYSANTKSELEKIAQGLKSCFDQMPDISDLATPSKLLKKKELKYVMKELPKDPLDITFGNDSGCCIFVPDSKDKPSNGEFVSNYLIDPGVRLFGLYRTEANKEQRMGLALAFETQLDGKKVLACNSIELSRFGIVGGNSTISKIVDYSEDWIIRYAELNGYDGATMGSHSYNTSVNFSKRVGDKLKDKLVFNAKIPFYSDIFDWDKENKILVTRDNSCYWLWKSN